jgi:hypothetical protein
VFSVRSVPRCYKQTVSGVSWIQLSGESWLVSEWVTELLRSRPCELLLWEAGSWGTGTVQEHRARGKSAVGNRFQATTGENTADWEDLVRTVVNCWVCKLATAVKLLIVAICKLSLNPITNPNPVYSHSYTWQHHTTCYINVTVVYKNI